MGRRVFLFAVILLASSLAATAQELLAGHRERIEAWRDNREYAAIVTYCQQQLARTVLEEVERHELTLELAHAALELALVSMGEDAVEAWGVASQAPLEYAQQAPANPRRAQLMIQAGMAHLARAETLLPMGEPGDDEPARAPLREAIKRFREARELIEEAGRKTPRPPRGASAPGAIVPFTSRELRSLDRHAAFLLAKSYRRQADTYPSRSQDRMHAARQAEELFRSLADLEDNVPLAWPSRVQLLACQRLLEDWPAAEATIERYRERTFPDGLAGDFQAERARLAIAQKQLDEAIILASDGAIQRALELDRALLEAYLAAAQRGAREDATKEERKRTALLVRAIGERWGAARGDLAAMLLDSAMRSDELAVDADAWELAGEAYCRARKQEHALSAYAAAQLAGTLDGDGDAALRTGMKAAALQRANGDIVYAGHRLRMLALNHTGHRSAPMCHDMAIHDFARSGASEAELREWLREHVRVWPQSASAQKYRDWLGEPRLGLPGGPP